MSFGKNEKEPEKNKLNEEKNEPIIKVTGKRWLILITYIIYNALSSLQWIQYSIIANIMMKYYNISAAAVDATSIIYLLIWPIMVCPASFIIDKMVSENLPIFLLVADLIRCKLLQDPHYLT